MKRLSLILAFLAAPAFAQVATCNTATIPICTPGTPAGEVQTKPTLIPANVTTTVAFSDAYITMLTFANPTGGAIVITIADRQGTPVAIPGSGASVAAGTSYVVTFPGKGYWAPGGFTVNATATGMSLYARLAL